MRKYTMMVSPGNRTNLKRKNQLISEKSNTLVPIAKLPPGGVLKMAIFSMHFVF